MNTMTKKKTKKTEPKADEPAVSEAPLEGEVLDAEPEAPASTPEDEALQTQLLRLRADFDNFRKRVQREKAETYQRANEDILLELLPVLDHFEMGLQTARQHETDAAVLDGFQLVHDQTLAALKRFGLEPVDAEGKAFDPHWHEAATYLPSDEHPEDSVMAQTRRGYKLGDRLLRPAQVVVSSGPAEPAAGEEA